MPMKSELHSRRRRQQQQQQHPLQHQHQQSEMSTYVGIPGNSGKRRRLTTGQSLATPLSSLSTPTSSSTESIEDLLKAAIVRLCTEHCTLANAQNGSGSYSGYGGSILVDGIICISGAARDGRDVIVKVHEILPNLSSPVAGTTNSADTSLNTSSSLPTPALMPPTIWSPQRSIKRESLETAAAHASSTALMMDNNNLHPDIKDNPMPLFMFGRGATSPHPLLAALQAGKHDTLQKVLTGGDPSFRHHYSGAVPAKTDRCSPISSALLSTRADCKDCLVTFANIGLLSEHNETVHSVYTCRTCFTTFTSRSNLERHTRLHTGHRPFICTICQKAFSRKDHLTNHIAKHSCKCADCNKRFSDRNTLSSHFVYEHSSQMIALCEFCNRGFSNHDHYTEHMRSHPMNIDPCFTDNDLSISPNIITSPLQSASLAINGTLSQMLKKRDFPIPASNLYRHECPNCGFVTASNVRLSKHMLIHTSPEKTYTCMACKACFNDPLERDDHMRIMHAAERRSIFECALCRNLAYTLAGFSRHEASHQMFDNVQDMSQQSPSAMTIGTSQKSPNEEAKINTIDIDIANSLDKSSIKPSNSMDYEIVEPESPHDSNDLLMDQNRPSNLMAALNSSTLFEPKHNSTPLNNNNNNKEEEVEPKPKVKVSKPHHRRKGSPEKAIDMSLAFDEDIDDDYGIPLSVIKIEPSFNDTGIGMLISTMKNSAATSSSSSASFPAAKKSTSSPRPSTTVSFSRLNVEIPAGPQTCALCQLKFDSGFAEMEAHCMMAHVRSPCMFCPKTFAQKANRDRHICLHTGDRPYACSDCEERFARGDKLKNHRIRAHAAIYAAKSDKSQNSSNDSLFVKNEKHSTDNCSIFNKSEYLKEALLSTTKNTSFLKESLLGNYSFSLNGLPNLAANMPAFPGSSLISGPPIIPTPTNIPSIIPSPTLNPLSNCKSGSSIPIPSTSIPIPTIIPMPRSIVTGNATPITPENTPSSIGPVPSSISTTSIIIPSLVTNSTTPKEEPKNVPEDNHSPKRDSPKTSDEKSPEKISDEKENED